MRQDARVERGGALVTGTCPQHVMSLSQAPLLPQLAPRVMDSLGRFSNSSLWPAIRKSLDSRIDIARISDPFWSILGFLLLDLHIPFSWLSHVLPASRTPCSQFSDPCRSPLAYYSFDFWIQIARFADPCRSILMFVFLDSRIHAGRFSYSISRFSD